MSPDEMTELVELAGLLPDEVSKGYENARRCRSEFGSTSHESPRMAAARFNIAQCMSNLADAQAAYLAEVRKAIEAGRR